ncbi:hypothetical protein TRVA0_006S01398 [Trichomonascus vanleenenianus]|uniref:class I SAM-dependent methyltransferase n=1 Tax=Trichomonascus vanleenenianus TaxID=2268995 RepID=UPI003ECAD0CF
MSSSEVREKYNELNQKAYEDEEKLSFFDDPNALTSAQMFAIKVLQFDHPSMVKASHERIDDDVIIVEAGGQEFDTAKLEEYYNVPNVSKAWSEDSTRVLDFACGTGNVARALAGYVKEVVGVDISQSPVDVFNKRAADNGVPKEEMRAYAMDILSDDQIKNDEILLANGKFDLATCSMSYHHIPDIDHATKRIGSLLKKGGWYFVMDFEAHAHHHHHGHQGAEHHHHHHHDQTKEHHGQATAGSPEPDPVLIKGDKPERLGVAHTEGIRDHVFVKAFKNAGFTNIGIEKAFQVKMWLTEDKYKIFSDKSLSETLSQVDKNGKTLYMHKAKLVMVFGMKA